MQWVQWNAQLVTHFRMFASEVAKKRLKVVEEDYFELGSMRYKIEIVNFSMFAMDQCEEGDKIRDLIKLKKQINRTELG